MKNIFISLFFVFNSVFGQTSSKIVYIQPLGDVKDKYLQKVKKSVESFYGFKCVIKPKVSFTNDLLADSKTRYEALKILGKFRSRDNILIVTEKDIAIRNNQYPEWGVLGLGFRPGTVCVISTFRMKRNVSEERILDRLEKVSLHEIGHNLGLNHCTKDARCMMNDAKGTISTVDRELIYFCPNCKKLIGMK
jgi:archaemetzincin